MNAFTRSVAPFLLLAGALATTTARAEDKVYTLKIATQAPEGTPWAQLITDYKAAVETASKGRIKIIPFLGGKAGDENATVTKASKGHLQGVAASTGAIASIVPELNAVEIPFMFNSFGEADYILDKVLTEPMEKLFKDRGLVLGFWSENGFRHFGSNFGPIKKPSDLEGKKMRSQESKVHGWMWEQFKAASQAIPTTEVLTALGTGACEGFDQTLLFSLAAKWHKTVKDMTLSAHIYQPAAVAFNYAWYKELPADLQKVLIDEGRKLTAPGRELIRGMNADLIKLVERDGVKIHKLSKDERAAFVAATASVRTTFREKEGAESKKILDLIEAGLKAFRK